MGTCAQRRWPKQSPLSMSTSCGSTKTPCGWARPRGFSPLISRREQVRHFTAEQFGLSANGILALTADLQGHIWMGTSGGGVLRYDGETFQSIRLGPSALENKVEAVLCDRRGRLWFGTRAGLVAYQPGHTPPLLGDPRGAGWHALSRARSRILPREHPGNPHSLPRHQLSHRRGADALQPSAVRA